MSIRMTSRSRVARAFAAAGLVAAAAAAAGPQVAGAATVTTTLNYSCNFPLLRPQPLQLKISAELPTTVPVNTATGAFKISAVADVNADAAFGLRSVASTSIEGSAIAQSNIQLPNGTDLPLDVDTTIAKTAIPATGGFTTSATGSTPSIKFPTAGTATVTVGDVVLTLTPRLADGTLTGLDTFETECKQVPGQNTVLAKIAVTNGGTTPTPTATPTKTPTPTVTPTKTPTPTPTPTGRPPVPYSYALSGSATLKTLSKGSLPLSGTANAQLTLATGAFTADLTLAETAGNLVALGFLPVRANVAIVPQGAATGTLNDAGLSVNTKVRIKIPKVTLFGLQLAGGTNCQAKNPTDIKLKSPGEFSPLDGGTIAGTFTISDLTGCGFLNGVVSPLTAGAGNAIALKLTPKATA